VRLSELGFTHFTEINLARTVMSTGYVARRGALAGLSAIGAFGIQSPLWSGRGAADTKGGTHDPLLYFSDYFFFVGRDGAGWVHFAIDNNRGRAGETYQADHFIVMHDEQSGWVQLKGGQHYDNAEKQLERIPESPYFKFGGSHASGTTLQSTTNDLRMDVGPIPKVLYRENADCIFWLGGAPATLVWNKRTVRRVGLSFLFDRPCAILGGMM
jgi:hypothetical protein